MPTATIFFSCVSNEFRGVRKQLLSKLTQLKLHVFAQEEFRDQGNWILETIDDYIKQSDGVLHIVGDRTGELASDKSIAEILKRYPNFADGFPQVPDLALSLQPGQVRLSYTQLEAYLALFHQKKLMVVKPSEDARLNSKGAQSDDPGITPERIAQERIAQERHLSNLKNLGRFPTSFTNADNLGLIVSTSFLGDILRSLEPPPRPKNLPRASLGSLFVGREREMEALEDALKGKSENRQPSAAAVTSEAIHGLGGIGKTQLAIEYAYRYAQNYSALLFVSAETPAILNADLASLVEYLNLAHLRDEPEDIRVKGAINWLNTHPTWLLIIDNVDDESARSAMQALLLRLQGGHVLITSRLSQFQREITKLKLDSLAVDDAVAYLFAATPSRPEDEYSADAIQAQKLAKELGGLALGLSHAAAYIEAQGVSFAEYLELWRSQRSEIISWFDHELINYNHNLGLAATWKMSFERLSIDAQLLMDRLAFFAPEPIPDLLLDQHGSADTKIVTLRQNFRELVKYSLVDSPKQTRAPFTVHRLVQDYARRRMDAARRGAALTEAIEWVNAAFVEGGREQGETHNLFDQGRRASAEDPTGVPTSKRGSNLHIRQLVPHIAQFLDFLMSDEFRDSEARDYFESFSRVTVAAIQFAKEIPAFLEKLPDYIEIVFAEYYETGPLCNALTILISEYPDIWGRIEPKLRSIAADNYVLRYALGHAFANAYTSLVMGVTKESLLDFIAERQPIHVFEFGGYALTHVLFNDTQQPDRSILARLASRNQYPGRSILGDLLINLALAGRSIDLCEMDNEPALKRFTTSWWDFVKLDASALTAIEAFVAVPRRTLPADADPESRNLFEFLEEGAQARASILSSMATKPKIQNLLSNYMLLGKMQNEFEHIADECASLSTQELSIVFGIFFSHPIWAVAEAAAPILVALIEQDHRHASVIETCFESSNWRVQFGANEAAFQCRTFNEDIFFESVRRFYNHENCKIRGLCAENLFSCILGAPRASREWYLQEFAREIQFWLKDEDCWVMEHVYRLFHNLHKRSVDTRGLLQNGVSRLLQEKSEWYMLERQDFLDLIEAKKRLLVENR